ncbi:MAG: type II toxin-antitoxin system PemK/MazF family toxin [Bacteroidota bacterium]|nr:type II toxin-antitoxin system PemK/MazF family toxin [Bacteroidota bacterium]
MDEVFVSQREIWLCPFPFSDLSGRKVRPVIVLSNDSYNSKGDDVVVCALTSSVEPRPYAIIID